MQEIHLHKDFVQLIFPELKEADELTFKRIISQHFGIENDQIQIHKDLITIKLPPVGIDKNTSQELSKVITLCDNKRFDEAKPLLTELLKKYPDNSELHRIKGQIDEEEGDYENAIDSLIESLKLNPNNGSALLMMGNIFARHKGDTETAVIYYKQAVESNHEDYITRNNLAYILFKQGNKADAQTHLFDSISINNKYPNSFVLQAIILESEDNLSLAFDFVIKALKVCQNKDEGIYQQAFAMATQIAERLVAKDDLIKNLVNKYKAKLELESGKEVKIIEDNTIQTPAKLEVAEVYGRDNHIVKYKPGHQAVEHLIMHELHHLEFYTDAREVGENQLFTSNSSHYQKFKSDYRKDYEKLIKMGFKIQQAEDTYNSIFSGLNSQIFNTPIDLFIENSLFERHPELRPFQLISLLSLSKTSIQAVTDKNILSLFPTSLISKSKILNLVGLMQLKELFGIDLVDEVNPTKQEHTQAQAFYSEFKEYQLDKEPAEEYELISNWANDLKVDEYFELVSEKGYHKRKDVDTILKDIETLEEDEIELDEVKSQAEFKVAREEEGVNMAVVMYMVDALQFFKDKTQDEIKTLAYEIAMLGRTGIDPKKQDYRLSFKKGKKISGYQVLAYYYVSWALAIPEMLNELQMGFEKEFEMANQMFSDK